MSRPLAFVLLILATCASPVLADSVVLMPTADASIFKSFPSNNIGAGTSLVAGANSAGNPARALIRYDFTGQLPPGAIVDAVGLELTVVNSPGSGGVASTFALHRMLVPWIEGTKTGNNGAIATAGRPTP